MNHLTDEQLTMILYQEPAPETDSWQQHLHQCTQCTERYDELVDTRNNLESDVVTPRDFDVDVKAIVDREASSPLPFPESSATQRSTIGLMALATSVLLFVGGASFLLGSVYQANQSTIAIQKEVALAVQAATASPINKPGLDLDHRIAKGIETQFSEIYQNLTAQNERSSQENLIALREIESRFQQMLSEQRALRVDLQTLAVNAEGEISTAQKNIRRIDEFVSLLLPAN